MKNPYYKLTIGKKPYTTADMRFPSGRIRIEVSDAYPDASKVLAGLCATRWRDMCINVLAFFDANPVSPSDYLQGKGTHLTEPPDHLLRDEVARMQAIMRSNQ